jgi:hypothetical protein
MPCLNYLDQVSTNLIANSSEFVRGKTVVGAQFDRFQPEFAHHALSANMDVQGFIAVKAVKEEPVWAFDIYDSRHVAVFYLLQLEVSLPSSRLAQSGHGGVGFSTHFT